VANVCLRPWGSEVWKACGPHMALEPRRHGVRPKGVSDLIAEDEALIRVGGAGGELLLDLAPAVDSKGGSRPRVYGDRPTAALGFGSLITSSFP
jgi:hypothetical protein